MTGLVIHSNDAHLARVLEARRVAGHRDVIQWWSTADRRKRSVLARYYQPVRVLLEKPHGWVKYMVGREDGQLRGLEEVLV